MNDRSRFYECAAYGDEAKRKVQQVFADCNSMIRSRDSLSAWDFQASTLQGDMISVEIKNENNQQHTGNLCIEMQQGSPSVDSGIFRTEADIVIHTLGDIAAAYRTIIMRRWAENEKQSGRKLMLIGDNHNMGYLFFRQIGIARWSHLYWEGPLSEVARSSVCDTELCAKVKIEVGGDSKRPFIRPRRDNQWNLFDAETT